MALKKILLFGSGFLAQHITDAARNNSEVRVIYNQHSLKDYSAEKQISIQDKSYIDFLKNYAPEYIICVQGNSFVPDNKNLKQALNSNVNLTLSFLEDIFEDEKLKKNIKKIIVVGSAAEYGRTYSEPISETFPLHPTSIYGLTKIFLYNMAIFYKEKGLPIVYTRQFNCSGPYQRESFLIPSLCKQIATIEKRKLDPVIIIGDLTQERDIIDAKDAAKTYLKLLEQGKVGEVYNIGSGKAYSVKEILDSTLNHSKINKKHFRIEKNETIISKEHSLSNRIQADISKLQNIGITPKHTLNDTIAATLEYWRNNV